jgi:DUF177 domain-containing protein
MLKVDLGRLGREGAVVVEASISAEDGLWDHTGLPWTGDVDVRLRATFAGTGEVVARGMVRGQLRQECRRCLRPVQTELVSDLTLVFVSGAGGEGAEGGAYAFEPTRAELDISSAVREEVLLAMNSYVVCDPDCLGFCSMCGTNLNEGECDCTEDETDLRWAALRGSKDE